MGVKRIGLVLIVTVLFSREIQGFRQYLDLFQSTNCQTPLPINGVNVYQPERTINNGSATSVFPPGHTVGSTNVPFYRSFYAFGMWQVGKCTGNTNPRCLTTGGGIEYTTILANQARCEPFESTGVAALDIRRLGDEALSAPELHLFEQSMYSTTGQGRKIVATSQGVTDIPFSINSYFFTGKNSWSVFEGSDHKGRRTCLRPSTDVSRRGYGFTFQPNSITVIKSVRYGCGSAAISAPSLFILLILACVIKKLYK